jgi:predicted aspartyl protease
MRPLPPAEIDNKLTIGGDAIAAREIGTSMGVEVMVNGHGPYRFIVDSGADTSVVGVRIAHDLQLPLGTPVILNDMTGRNLVDRVKVDELDFGPSTVTNLEVPALQEQNLGSDGVLGIDALVQQRLMIDFEKRLVKVEDARTRTPHYPDEIVITARRDRGQLILTRVRAAGVRLNAVVDTGSEITVGNLALRDKLLRKKPSVLSTATMVGVTGKTVVLQIAVIPELELGPVTLRNVPIAFADVPPFTVFGLDQEPSLLLGTDILETFRRISLDFRARKIRFQLRRCSPEAVSIDTAPEPMLTYVFSTGAQEVCGQT